MGTDSDTVRRVYDRLAADYDRRWRPYIEATLRSALGTMSFHGGEEVLDVACGTGELERMMLERWPELKITAVDISPAMLREAEAKNRGQEVTWIEADAGDLPVPESRFDCIVCANSFHYFRQPAQALTEWRRVLRPGGKLVLVDWCDDYLICKICSLWLRMTDRAFYRTYSLARCRALVEQAGFEVVASQRFRINLVWGLMRLTCTVS